MFRVVHHNPMAGDLGQDKTVNHLMAHQLVNLLATPKVPLCLLLLIKVHFERIDMDHDRPLVSGAQEHHFVL